MPDMEMVDIMSCLFKPDGIRDIDWPTSPRGVCVVFEVNEMQSLGYVDLLADVQTPALCVCTFVPAD